MTTWRRSGEAAVLLVRHITAIVVSVTDPFGCDAVAAVALERVRTTRLSCNQRTSFRSKCHLRQTTELSPAELYLQ